MSARWDYDSMFIDGAWTADDVVGVVEVIDPATEEVIGSVPDTGIKAAHAASRRRVGPSTTGRGRGRRRGNALSAASVGGDPRRTPRSA